MKTILQEILIKYINSWESCVVNYGVYENNTSTKSPSEFVYYFEVGNGAFDNETLKFECRYFRELNRSEIIKFVFRSLASEKSIYDFIGGKFRKRFICY